MPLPAVKTLHLYPGERAALLALLRSLAPDAWSRPTACPGWTVKDIAAHLVADDAGQLGRGRDAWTSPTFATGLDISTFDGLVQAINRQNAEWVHAMKRVSPPLLIDLLQLTGDQTHAYFASLEMEAPGALVDWAGPDTAPIWMDVAREYTERWVHQQHIREAVGHPGLTEPEWLHPVLACFAFGLARPLATIDAEEGTTLHVEVNGPAGGSWFAVRVNRSWDLRQERPEQIDAMVQIPEDIAWRLFTKGISPQDARARSTTTGDPTLTSAVFATVSILA